MNGERAAAGDADGALIARFLAGERGAFDSRRMRAMARKTPTW